jgi:dnd system-associated protein 4
MLDETSRDTVAIDATVHELYKRLTEGNDILNVPFRSMKDMFMWAVCLGVQQGRRKPLTSKRVTIFRWAQLDSQIDVPLLKAIAIAKIGDVDVLLRRNEILTLAEEYANAGIYDLRDAILEDYRQPLWNLVDLLG